MAARVRIAIVITARPSYAKVRTLIAALVNRHVDVQLIVCASALLERYGKVVDVIRKDWPYVPITEVWSTYEGANLLTSAKETGALLTELSSVLLQLRADACVVCADRHEVLAAAQAASYLHLSVVHLQGGERSGSIDDRVRDAITQLADVHLVATDCARLRVYSLTGRYDNVYNTGCPSLDVAKQALSEPPVTVKELGGAGTFLDPQEPFLMVLQHPVTNEMDQARAQMDATLNAVIRFDLPVLVMWPGQDAGMEDVSKQIRLEQQTGRIHTLRNLPPNRFLRLLTQCSVLIGNSSAGIRECSYLGVPIVNVGTRQQGRERGPNVVDVPHNAGIIAMEIARQREHGRYPMSTLYGDGTAGEKMADVLCG